jgi:hypothetical protein
LKPLRNLIKYILRHFPNRASAIDFDRDVAPHAIRWLLDEAMNARNVLHVNAVEETAAYRSAVAEILRRVQSGEGLTLLEISERIDVSLGTISNAANKKADLSPTY